MRKCDIVTILRIFLVFVSLALLSFYNFFGLALIPLIFFLDFLDGFIAKNEKQTAYGKRLDVAGDRITEYLYYFFFSVYGLIPFFVFPIIVVRNSFVDSFFYTPKKNFSTAKTKIAKLFSASRFSRVAYALLKMFTFFYFGLVLIFNFPIEIGYALLFLVVGFSIIRGIADIYEVFH